MKAEHGCANFEATIATAIYGAIQSKSGLRNFTDTDSSSSLHNNEAVNKLIKKTLTRESLAVVEGGKFAILEQTCVRRAESRKMMDIIWRLCVGEGLGQ